MSPGFFHEAQVDSPYKSQTLIRIFEWDGGDDS